MPRTPQRQTSRPPTAATPTDIAQVLDSLRRIVRELQRSHRMAEQRWDISAAQLLVLQQLAGAGSLSVNDLADRTFTHQSTVSVVVTRLVRRRLVVRERADDDARRTEISLTPAGRKLLAGAMTLAQTRLIEALRHIPQKDMRTLRTCLQVLVRELGADEEPAMMFFERDGAPESDGRGTKRSRAAGSTAKRSATRPRAE